MLYKLLAAHPQIGYLNNHLAHAPWLDLLSVGNRLLNSRYSLIRKCWYDEMGGAFFDKGRIWYKKFVPSPAECESVYKRCGMPTSPDPDWRPDARTTDTMRRVFERARRLNATPVLLSKRTSNNRRIPQLDAVFPGARYIALIRDGRAVADSLVRVSWWNDHTLYWNGRTPRELVGEGALPLELAARNWLQEMKDMQAGLARLDPSQVLEVSYARLLQHPREELGRMLQFLGADPGSSPDYWQMIDSLELKVRPESWRSKWTAAERELVESIQGDMLRQLNLEAI